MLFAEFNLNCSKGTNDAVDTIKKKAEARTPGFCLSGGLCIIVIDVRGPNLLIN